MLIAVLSDIHANLEALDVVLAAVDEAGVGAMFVLGDIVGYNADPDAVIARLGERADAVLLAGNHDLAATGRFDTAWFNSVAAAAIDWTRDALSAAAADHLRTLVPREETAHALLVHGSVRDPAAEYVTSTARARDSFEAEEFSLCFFGHTHMPTLFADEGGRVSAQILSDGEQVSLPPGTRHMLNPGSVGQPRDGDPRASFLVYDTEARTAVVRRLGYPIDKTQAKILAAGLPRVLAERLAEGR